MKKALIIVVLIVFAKVIFAQELVGTSEGDYIASIYYDGHYRGQSLADHQNSISGMIPVKLTNVQLYIVQRMLNKYNTTMGDTYVIAFFHNIIRRDLFVVICEFTSNTQYRYWAARRLI